MHKTRAIIVSAFVLGGLALGCTATSNAWAATTKSLEPDSNWSVSKIDAKDTKRGEAYCALARRFDEDVILTFARNAQNESSVAFDLQKQEWNPLREYKVSLSAGYGENRSYELKPVSSGAFVARLGDDPSFFDALGRSEKMEMRVDEHSYTFALTDLLKGQQKLNECLVGLPMTEKKAEDDSAEPAISPQQAEPDATSKKLENLRQENLRLRNALERERRTYEDRFMSESVDSSAVSELSEKVRILEIENGKLHTQLTRLKEDMSTGQESCMAASNDKAKVEKASQESGKAMKALQAENKRLKDSLAEQAKRLALLEKVEAKTNKEAAENKTSVKADVAALKKVRFLEEEIAVLRDQNKALKLEVQAFRDAKEEERINISSANWNLEKATRRFNEAEREIRRLGGMLEEERAKCAREKREIEYMLFDPEIAEKEQTERLLELEKELDKAKTELKRTKDTYKDRINYLEEELASAQKPVVRPPEKQPVVAVQKEPVHAMAQSKEPKVMSQGEEPTPVSKAPAITTEQVIAAERDNRKIKAELNDLEQERKELLRRVSRLQQENARLQAEKKYKKPPVSAVPAMASAKTDKTATVAPVQREETSPPPRQMAAQSNTSAISRPAPSKESNITASRTPVKAQVTKNVAYMTENDLEDIFRQGGIKTNDGVHRIDVGNDIVAHSWTAGRMFGSSEQSEMDYAGQYDSYVTRYLGKTEGRCPGEFASVPSQEKRLGSIRASAYEIACVGDENAASAAILFFNKDGVFTAIAHETTVDGMDIAMDARDRLFDVLTSNTSLSQRR